MPLLRSLHCSTCNLVSDVDDSISVKQQLCEFLLLCVFNKIVKIYRTMFITCNNIHDSESADNPCKKFESQLAY